MKRKRDSGVSGTSTVQINQPLKTNAVVPPPASSVSVTSPFRTAPARLREIDILRGFVMVLMALDHTRDFFYAGAFTFDPLDPDRTNVALYATRWITHLCAPTFVFLAGVSVFLQSVKGKQSSHLSYFLFSRGAWLVAVELSVVSFGWSFAVPFPLFLQVIWAIGWSMITLAGLVWFPHVVVLGIAILIIAGHNLFDPLKPDDFGQFSLVWTILHERGPLTISGMPMGFVSYPIMPWIGVMALGFGLGPLFLKPQQQRTRTFLCLGAAMIVLFILLRGFNLYGNPHPWMVQGDLLRSAMAFLNVQKYPPSLMFVLVTLGLALVLLPLLERLRGPAASFLLTLGAVPFFFYVLHIYLIHALAIPANAALGRVVSAMINFLVNMISNREHYADLGFPLVGVYIAWVIVIVLLYPPCRWWLSVKQTRRHWWLPYL
jgi:uncharacterized membrane protein